MTRIVVRFGTLTAEQTVFASSFLTTITAKIFVRLPVVSTFHLHRQFAICYTVDGSPPCVLARVLAAEIVAVVSDEASLHLHLRFVLYKFITYEIAFLLVSGHQQVPEVVKDGFLLAGRANDFELLLVLSLGGLVGQVGLNAVEAGMVLAPEVDGLDGSPLADRTFMVGH